MIGSKPGSDVPGHNDLLVAVGHFNSASLHISPLD
jgi:hypothetical protein